MNRTKMALEANGGGESLGVVGDSGVRQTREGLSPRANP